MAGEKNADGGAFTFGRSTRHPSPVLLDDPERHGETEAGAFALFFGGEEWLEYLFELRRGDAGAVVADGDFDELTALTAWGARAATVAGNHGDRPPVR